MDEAATDRYIATALPGVDVVVASREGGAPEIAWGDSFFIYDPDLNKAVARVLILENVQVKFKNSGIAPLFGPTLEPLF